MVLNATENGKQKVELHALKDVFKLTDDVNIYKHWRINPINIKKVIQNNITMGNKVKDLFHHNAVLLHSEIVEVFLEVEPIDVVLVV